MTECRYCHKDLSLGTNDGFYHQACIDESHRRKARGSCVMCGKDVLDSGFTDCASCMESPIDFQGYPGPC